MCLDSCEDYDEDKNLSWLFNFRLDELPHLSPEVNRSAVGLKLDEIIKEATSGDIPNSVDDDRYRTTTEVANQPDSPEQYGLPQYQSYTSHDQVAAKL